MVFRLSNNTAHYIFDGFNTYHDTYPFRLELLYESGVYKLRPRILKDDWGHTTGSKYNISNAWHVVEIEWKQASAPGANNGYLSLWIDGNLVGTISGVDNDHYLNHFTQPDSIVPDPYNSQDWNRYAYARNNPLRYNDPTGHAPSCDDGPSTWAKCKEQLTSFAQTTVKKLGGKNDLEAVINIVNKAAQIYKNYEDMIPVLSGIFLGIEESNSMTVYNAVMVQRAKHRF